MRQIEAFEIAAALQMSAAVEEGDATATEAKACGASWTAASAVLSAAAAEKCQGQNES